MTATEIFAAWGQLSIYTNAESCAMVCVHDSNCFVGTENISLSVRCRHPVGRFQRYLHYIFSFIDISHVLFPSEYIYGTTIQHNYDAGWGVITLSSYDVFQQTRALPGYQTLLLGQVLSNETDPLFSWQYNDVRLSFPMLLLIDQVTQ